MASTTLQAGFFSGLTDTFAQTLDLNDRVTFFLQDLHLPQPTKVYVSGFNIRAPGEAVSKYQYKNREIVATLYIYGANTTGILGALRGLYDALERPPYHLKVQLAGGATFSYFTVVRVEEIIPYDAVKFQQGYARKVEIHLEALPGCFTGPKQWLSNLLLNPGFEQWTGGSANNAAILPPAFTDTYPTFNAYQNNLDVVYDAAVTADAPIDNYKLEDASGSAVDSGSGARNGTANGSITYLQSGPLGSTDPSWHAETFNGSTGFFSVPFNAAMNPANWTVEAWAFPTGGTGTNRMVFSTRDTANNRGFMLYATTANVWATQAGNGAAFIAANANTTPLALNAWTHLLATYDGANLRLYVNGVLAAGPTAVTQSANATQPATIGKFDSGGFFVGSLSRVALYSTALSATRALAHYQAGVLGVPTNVLDAYYDASVLADAPVDNWKLEDASGSAADAGSNALALTANGSVTYRQSGPQGALDPAWHAETFDGSTGFFSRAFSAALNPAQWTVEAWVYLTGGTGPRAIFSTRDSANNRGMMLYVDVSGVWAVQLGNGAGFFAVGSPAVGTLFQWNHLAGTYDGTTLRLYLNGAQVGTPNVVGFSANATQPATIGKFDQGGFFPGSLSRVALYSSALSAGRIAAHYTAGSTVTGAPPVDLKYYPDYVLADSPVRYHRLSETSGTSAKDALGRGNGTYVGGVTLGSGSLLTGDGNGAATFNGTTGYMSGVSGNGIPSGAGAPATVECWFKISGFPAALVVLAYVGATLGVGTAFYVQMDSTGHVTAAQGAVSTTASAPVSLNVPHHLVGTYDGTKMHVYLDGVEQGTGTAAALTLPSNGSFTLGAVANPANFFPGVLDEGACYQYQLPAARILAHYNAGIAAPAVLPQSTILPALGRLDFGSANWGPMQWQQRFRWFGGAGTVTWYLHYVNSNNWIAANLTQTTLSLVENVAGVQTPLASTGSVSPVNEVGYWITLIHYPALAGDQPNVSVILNSEGSSNGPAFQLAKLDAQTLDTTTALLGHPAVACSANMSIGLDGTYTLVTSPQAVTLFGPGGWNIPFQTGTNQTLVGWETDTTKTYPGGPVQSAGALRIDFPTFGTGTSICSVGTYNGGGIGQGYHQLGAIPISPGQVLGVSGWVKSSGLGASGICGIQVNEWDANGNFLRQTSPGFFNSATSNAGWSQIAGTSTIGASTAWASVYCAAIDSSGSMASAGASVWFDNMQAWNQTLTGQATMPWCDLRHVNSPATLVVSGLLGELETPAFVAFGLYQVFFGSGSVLYYALGRRAIPTFKGRLTGPVSAYGGTPSPDAFSLGGYTVGNSFSGSNSQVLTSYAQQASPADLLGVYRVFQRVYSEQTGPNLPNLAVRTYTDVTAALGQASVNNALWTSYGPFISPLSSGFGSGFVPVESGLAYIPPYQLGATSDLTQNFVVPRQQWLDKASVSAALFHVNWECLLPADATTLTGQIINPNNTGLQPIGMWTWGYVDGLGVLLGTDAATTMAFETNGLPSPSNGNGGSGTLSTGQPSINQQAAAYITLDPQAALDQTGATGVNQLAGYVADNFGGVDPLHCEIAYYPTYLSPK